MYDFFNSLFGGLFGQLRNLFSSLFSFMGDIYHDLTSFIGNLFSGFWNAFTTFITNLFGPILDFFDAVLYLFKQAFVIVILVLKVIAALFGLLISFANGIINTLIGFAGWSGSTQYYSLADPLQTGMGFTMGIVNQTGLNILPLVIAVFIWLLTAYGVFKIVGGRS